MVEAEGVGLSRRQGDYGFCIYALPCIFFIDVPLLTWRDIHYYSILHCMCVVIP